MGSLNNSNKGSTKVVLGIIIGVVIIAIIGFLVYTLLINDNPNITPDQNSSINIQSISLAGITAQASMAKNYELPALSVDLATLQYTLPLKNSDVNNYDSFSSKIQLSNEANNLLKQNGFVVIKNPFNQKEEYITSPYDTLKDNEIPIFVTSDSLLHLYHIQFDETLRQVEEREFYDAIWNIDKSLLDKSITDYNSATALRTYSIIF